ncbi:MAG: hypothetical protein ACRDKV_05770 [Solirubrobacterales bacterium]
MAETVTIARRFRGPPQNSTGGHACGLLWIELRGEMLGAQP